jgi:hypothetical protein
MAVTDLSAKGHDRLATAVINAQKLFRVRGAAVILPFKVVNALIEIGVNTAHEVRGLAWWGHDLDGRHLQPVAK